MLVQLYVLRHAHSLKLSEAGITEDAERPISDRGRREIDDILNELTQRGAKPIVILHSPLKRTTQTAKEAAKKLCPTLGAKSFEPLSNQISGPALFERLWKDLASIPQLKAAKKPEVMIVGHQPQLGEMVSHLSKRIIELKPGGVIAMEISDMAKAAILWSRNP